MNYEEILEDLNNQKQLSNLISLKRLGAGIVGELFESFVLLNLNKKFSVNHINKDNSSSADIIIDGSGISCKTTSHNSRQINIKNKAIDTNGLKKLSEKEIGDFLLDNLESIITLMLDARKDFAVLSFNHSDDILSKIMDGEFRVIRNEKSVAIEIDNQKYLRINNDGISVNKSFFSKICSININIIEKDPYELLGALLK